jgi:ribosomal protein S18 acetylase RimI-like enzyme
MRPVMRAYAGEADYWRVRAFLRDLLVRNGLHLSMWHVSRWDYWRWHVLLNCEPQPMEKVVMLWEADGAIAAVLNPDNPGDAFVQVDPRHRSPALERELLAAAEERLPSAVDGHLDVWVPASDAAWCELLETAGYHPTENVEHVRAASLAALSATPPPPGYRIRPVADEDFPARGDLSLRVFHPVPDGGTAITLDEYRNIQRAPLYRRDLDLVAETDEGELAGFAGIWFDDVTRTAQVEPMGVDAPHRGRGVGRALLLEAMRRAARLGAVTAYVGSYAGPAQGLYASAGMGIIERLVAWRRPG